MAVMRFGLMDGEAILEDLFFVAFSAARSALSFDHEKVSIIFSPPGDTR
jgi:hypothetical protein